MEQVEALGGGIGQVTKSVCEALRGWLVEAGRTALDQLPEVASSESCS